MTKLELLIEYCSLKDTPEGRWISYEEFDTVIGKPAGNGRQYNFIRSGGQYNYEYCKTTKRIRIYKESSEAKKPVPDSIRKSLKGSRCVMIGTTSKVQIDHKVGHPQDPDYSNTDIELFQPLHESVNYAKREYCNKTCVTTGKRFDARQLGYKQGFYEGDEEFRGTCKGCMWFDIKKFREEL